MTFPHVLVFFARTGIACLHLTCVPMKQAVTVLMMCCACYAPLLCLRFECYHFVARLVPLRVLGRGVFIHFLPPAALGPQQLQVEAVAASWASAAWMLAT